MTIAQQLKIKDFPFEIKDKNGNQIYLEAYDGYSIKREYDANGKMKYIMKIPKVFKDNRPKQVVEVTLEDIANKMGIKVEQLRIKD